MFNFLKNKNIRTSNKLGNAYSRKHENDEAIKSYKIAIAINSNDAKAYYELGLAYIKKGDKQIAYEYIKKAAQFGHADAQKYCQDNNIG